MQFTSFYLPVWLGSFDCFQAAHNVSCQLQTVMLRKGIFKLADSHVVVADVSREQEFTALHGPVVENKVECKELEVQVGGKAGVVEAHEVLYPFMQFNLPWMARRDVGKAEGEQDWE